MPDGECVFTEAQLQRHCGSLYTVHALDSTCGLILFTFFSIVAVKLHARNHLRSPAWAFVQFVSWHVYEFLEEFATTMSTVGQMSEMNLEVRLRFCGNVDKMTNAASAVLSLMGITRWLSIGNVNGMRYIGYALTCPFTQLELVVLIAPIVPCYRFVAAFAFVTAMFCLSCAYVASLLWMPVYDGDFLLFLESKDLADLAPTLKAYVVVPALCGISVLWFLVLPTLMALWTMKGGHNNEDLPQEYRFLVMVVWCTWILFPCWWFFSWEGNAVITDTKLNEVGFTLLNMLAKGLFTWQGFRVGELNDIRKAVRRSWRQDERAATLRPSWSTCTAEGKFVPPVVSRASSRKLSASRFVQVLRLFDDDDEEIEDEEEEEEEESAGEEEEDRGERLKDAGMGKQSDRALPPAAEPHRERPTSQAKYAKYPG